MPLFPRSDHHLGAALRLATLLAFAGSLFAGAPAASAATTRVTSDGPISVTLSTVGTLYVGQPTLVGVIAANTTTAPVGPITMGASVPAGTRLSPNTAGLHICSGGATSFSCDIGILQPGMSVEWTFYVTPSATGTLDIAGSTGPTVAGSGVPSNRVDLLMPVAPAPGDVQVSGSASTGSPLAGAQLRYTFQVKNGSSQPALSVTLTDVLPAGETIVSATASTAGATCGGSGGTVTCRLGDFAGGSQATVVVTVLAPTLTGTYTTTATASTTNGDANLANNSAGVTIQVK